MRAQVTMQAQKACVLLQIYACPIYETMDTAWGRVNHSTWSVWNITERFVSRVIYMALTTFVAALLPFFGDFIALTGSLSALPLDFVLVLAMTLKVRLPNQSGISDPWQIVYAFSTM